MSSNLIVTKVDGDNTRHKRGYSEGSSSLRYAKFVVLRPAGYPLKIGGPCDFPELSEPKVFEHYAKEQWEGERAIKGCYLFDKRMFPDFAFEIKAVEPNDSVIGGPTVIIVEKPGQEESQPIPKMMGGVSFSDIIGQEEAKSKCKLIERYLHEPAKFGVWAPKNILFHGPSGTGKTMMAKALATETDVPLIPMKATQLIGEHVGEGARRIHMLYNQAEELAPCIIFIDELDAIALDRKHQDLRGDVSEVVNALLTEMDGIEDRIGVCTIGATNRISALDYSIRSRFEEEIQFKMPTLEERLLIFKHYSKTFPQQISSSVRFEQIARETNGLSGRDLVEKILKTALHRAIIEESEVLPKHFEDALKQIPKTSEPPRNMFG